MLQCKERNEQIVIPVFYHVDPAHVRKQLGDFGKAFSELVAKRFNDKTEKVKEWRAALTTAANLSGWDSSVKRDEAKLVEAIVEDVVTNLKCMSTKLSDHDFEGLVGTEERIKEIESLLCTGTFDVRTIGIWGMGGIGKTTLASVVFNRFSSQFEGCCFLANVREEWAKGQKKCLQNILFSELLREENPYNVKERLKSRKVLIVLDDVNDQEQLEFLLGGCKFHSGSRIIVTTRDMQMLRYIGADAIYQVEKLNQTEALQLFHLSAFKRNFPTTEYIELSKRVVDYAKGIPLALKVLGSFLSCKRRENWEIELDSLKQGPSDKINDVLKVSYDGLREKERQIFLDITCFFKGMYRDYVEEILNACRFFANIGIDNLIEKSLVTIRYPNILWMHDLVQEMGWEIVLSTREPGKRSRLWVTQDVIHVLRNETGTEAVEGIFLDTSHIGEVDLSPKVFKKMHGLRLLKIDDKIKSKLKFSEGLQCLPDALRYLNWYYYPLRSLPSKFSPHNLVELEMPYCKLKQLWHGVQQLGNLKHINLMHSEHLTQMPDLSCAPKLESINLQYCTSLLHVPSLSFRTFNKPTSEGQTFLRTLRDPATLILNGCSSLKSLPDISGNMKYLHLSYTAIEELPTSILSLDDLTLLDLTGCNLKNLPNNISKLGSLKDLYLRNCSSFNKFPELPRNIVKLDLSGTAIEQVPSSIKHVSTLQELHLINCTRLMNLSTSICELKHLRDLSLLRCSKLENFPEILEPMESLGSLDLRETGITGLPRFSLVNLITLRNLFLDDCENLASVPHSIFCISSLQRLSLSNCPRVELLPAMSQICLHRLKEVNMSNCGALELPDWFGCLSSLETLDLRGNHFDTIPKSIKNIAGLIELQISNCKNLRSLPDLPLSVGFLDASGCTSLETVSNSKTNLVQGHWNDYHVTLHKEFLFSDCSKLDQNARDNIMTESYIRILRAAILSVLEPGEKFYLLNEKPSVSICCPGNEIPKWFSDQYAKSSVTIKLTPDWHENFIGFALGAIVAFEDCYFEGVSIELRCQFYFKTKYGESGKFLCSFEEFWDLELQNEFTILNSDHVFMWYKHEDYHDYIDAVEVSFDFLLREFDHDGLHISSCNNKFRNCGVRLLYVQDAEGFGIDSNPRPFGEQDDIFDEAEPGGDETIDFDTDEPHPKRTKLSNL